MKHAMISTKFLTIIIRRRPSSTLFPYTTLFRSLRILAREAPAGYHQIETAFALLELTDELMVTRTAGGVALTVHGPDLGAPEQNLAVRAARAVLEATGHKFGVAPELTKRIPVQSGRGG